ncbi:MAG: restriction endonuclease [Ectothiorhodospiraceae bacterium AqS1]|nr:restriction endonuclease [Ectothiorhodospiraceae bacterium AqS1]
MSIPSVVEFFRPVLEAHQDGERRLKDVSSEIGESLEFSEEEKRELIPSQRQTKLHHRVSWAKTYLTMAGLLRTTKWGYSEITDDGLKALKSLGEINIEYLEQFESFREFRSRRSETSKDKNETPGIIDERSLIPEEDIERNFDIIKKSLAKDLRNRIHEEKPQFFEKLIVDLLIKMGYGGMGEVIGGSGDGGVDGVIHQDLLGIDKIYLQAKRYALDKKIAGNKIREFSGALEQKQVKRGVFVTTSSFTDDALVTAKNLNIILIDGHKLADLMIDYDIGCQIDRIYKIKKIDEDYFD